MSAGLLREAAALMRQRAEAATPSPWASVSEEHRDHGGADTYSHVLTADERTYIAQPDTEPDAEHIASWHPAVALAVAAWLDNAADRRQFRGGPRPEFAHAEVIAAAYLGRQS